MKKEFLFVSSLLIVTLFSCNGGESKSTSSTSIVESSSVSSSLSSEESSVESSSLIESSSIEVTSEEESTLTSEETSTTVEETSEVIETSIIESSEEESSLGEDTSIIEESSSSLISESSVEEELILDFNAIPETSQGAYNKNFTFELGDYSFFGDRMQRGSGDHEGTIQFSNSTKGSGYFYNLTPMSASITLTVKKQTQSYSGQDFDFTGVPTIYVGEEINPSLEIEPLLEETDRYYIYKFSVPSYFKIVDESEYKMLLKKASFVIE